jgi:S1-C subfamily serine protease
VTSTPPPEAPPSAPAPPAAQPATAAPSAVTPARELSPEQRAWEAAARMAQTGPNSGMAPLALSDPPVTPTGSVEEVVDAAMPAIVVVETTRGRGSGFFVAHDTAITNMHVVQQDQYVTLRRKDGSTLTARVHTRAPHFDIAILKVAQASTSQSFLQMATVKDLRAGQEVIVIGSALGSLQSSSFRGSVSNLNNAAGVTLIRSDVPAKPGTSGGPMLDRSGHVVGILTGGYEKEGVTFAVSIDHARDILEGRETNLGTGSSGLSNIVAAPPSGAEAERRQGEQAFRQGIDSAEQGAAKLDQIWQGFRTRCHTSPILGSYDREWFVVYVPGGGGLPGNAAAGCAADYQSMITDINRFRDFMRTTVQDARRANVLPGTIRDTLRSKRLTFEY